MYIYIYRCIHICMFINIYAIHTSKYMYIAYIVYTNMFLLRTVCAPKTSPANPDNAKGHGLKQAQRSPPVAAAAAGGKCVGERDLLCDSAEKVRSR